MDFSLSLRGLTSILRHVIHGSTLQPEFDDQSSLRDLDSPHVVCSPDPDHVYSDSSISCSLRLLLNSVQISKDTILSSEESLDRFQSSHATSENGMARREIDINSIQKIFDAFDESLKQVPELQDIEFRRSKIQREISNSLKVILRMCKKQEAGFPYSFFEHNWICILIVYAKLSEVSSSMFLSFHL